ncbi:type IIL restriction-modification enzyme MmeI [Stenotrophomonas sp. YIM B06876]|uniref:type IIL restriction-modification enzyme MmeI n=1 Tax=Stenotrophomonas sp. YIM B06876 TaxID=3060211 RepID=UPI00273844EA|nr:type IIL restriction-modification enzyme MmeI [Stenotrophomonas sp. YIM B06876]
MPPSEYMGRRHDALKATGYEGHALEGLLVRLLFCLLADDTGIFPPLTMPPALVKAHQKPDKAVDAAYLAAEKAVGRKPPKLGTDAERVAFLFQRYQALVSRRRSPLGSLNGMPVSCTRRPGG